MFKGNAVVTLGLNDMANRSAEAADVERGARGPRRVADASSTHRGSARNAASSAPLKTVGLTKQYSDGTCALRDFDLEVRPGEIVGLLGRNGAGKSTTVRLLVGLERPTSGDVRVFGAEPSSAARDNLIGYCGQEVAVYPSRTVEYNLRFFAEVAGLRGSEVGVAVQNTAADLGLQEHLQRCSAQLSGGFKRRLHLGIALIGGAPVLVLDEPTAGVDVESSELIVDRVRLLAESGRAVVYTSHDLTEMERLCDRVVILSRGVTRACGTMSELASSVGQLVRLEFEQRAERDRARDSFAGAARSWGSVGLELQLPSTQSAAATVNMIQEKGWRLRRVEVLAPGLESIFLQVIRSEEETHEPA